MHRDTLINNTKDYLPYDTMEITTELALGRSIVTSMATAQVASASNFSTNFAANTHQVRVTSTLPLWATIGSTQTITANSSATFIPANLPEYFTVTSGQVLNFLTTSTSTGYVVLTEMT